MGARAYLLYFRLSLFPTTICESRLIENSLYVKWRIKHRYNFFADKYPYLVITEYCMKIILTVLTCIGLYTVMQVVTPKLAKLLCGR